MGATIEQIAQVCHAANAAWCLVNGDDSQVNWGEAPEWQKESAVNGVFKALEGATPEQMHQNWCDVKTRDGWVYGETKDPEAKTHPCLVPYDQLPPEQRVKDHLFSAVVAALS